MRHVVLPQALRRVVPPLLNDFVSLLKDVALVSVLGVYEGVRQAQIDSSESFTFTPYVVAAVLFLVLTIPLTRYTDRTDLILTVQDADSPAGPWTDLAQSSLGAAFVSLATGTIATESGTGTPRTVTITDPYDVTDAAHRHRFMRLKIVVTD